MILSSLTQADYIEKDQQYIYVNTPLKQMFSDKESSKEVMAMAFRVFSNFMGSIKEKGLLPKDVETFDDLERMTEYEEKITKSVDAINKWTAKAKDSLPFDLDVADVIPDGFYVTIGGKVSGNFGFGLGASVSLGVIVLPINRKVISRQTLEVVEDYNTVDIDFVVWPAPSAGVGAGGGVRPRIGAGFIWDLDGEMDDADDFKGFGMGPTTTIGIGGVTFNVKAGILNSTNLNGIMDFLFVSASWSPGMVATGEGHISANVIVPMKSVIGILGDANEKATLKEMDNVENTIRKETEKLLDDVMKNAGGFSIEIDINKVAKEAEKLP
jgi:hypothetical protein